MDNLDDNFLNVLKTKQASKLPEGFDDRFWDKFDKRFESKKKKQYFLWAQLIGVPSLLLLFLVIWGVSHETASPFNFVNTTTDMNEEEMDLASNIDVLETVDLEEGDFPATDEEWNQLLGGIQNGDG